MSLLRKLTHKEGTEEQAVEEQTFAPDCPHKALIPRWDSVEDMGKEDRATSYFCEGCERTFTPEEARPYMS